MDKYDFLYDLNTRELCEYLSLFQLKEYILDELGETLYEDTMVCYRDVIESLTEKELRDLIIDEADISSLTDYVIANVEFDFEPHPSLDNWERNK